MPVLAQTTSDFRQRELKDRAHRLTLKGKLNDALEVYQQLISAAPKDATLRLHHADLCLKLERPQAAVASYLAAAQLFSQAGHVARAKAAVGCGLRISPKDEGLMKALRALNPLPPAVPKTPTPKLTVAWTQPVEAEAVRERVEVTEKTPEPRRAATSHLRLVPVAESIFDDEDCVTEPYIPLFDWLEAEEQDEPLAPRPPFPPGPDQHLPMKVTVSQRPGSAARGRR